MCSCLDFIVGFSVPFVSLFIDFMFSFAFKFCPVVPLFNVENTLTLDRKVPVCVTPANMQRDGVILLCSFLPKNRFQRAYLYDILCFAFEVGVVPIPLPISHPHASHLFRRELAQTASGARTPR